MNKLLSFFHRRKSEQEFDDEFKFRLQQQREEYLAKGMTPEEARYVAMRALGNVEQHKEECRTRAYAESGDRIVKAQPSVWSRTIHDMPGMPTAQCTFLMERSFPKSDRTSQH